MSLNHKFERKTKGFDKWSILFLVIISALMISALIKAIELYNVTR